MKKNSLHKLEITSYSSEGNGIGRIKGIAVFVKDAIVGEKVEVKIIKVKKNYAYAKLINVIQPSENRIKPDCVHASECGGCSLRHMKYVEELDFKLKKVNDALERIGKTDFKINLIHGANDILRYRNKASFPVGADKYGNINIGIFQTRSHNIIDIDECLIQSSQAEIVISLLKQWMIKNNIKAYDEHNYTGLIRHIIIRTNYKNEFLICLVTTKENIHKIENLISAFENSDLKICGIVQNIQNKNTNVILGDKFINLWKDNYLIDKICGLKFRLSAPSFFQVNRKQAEVLYQIAINFANLTKDDTVIDLYCGTGTITLQLAKKCGEAIGVEIIDEAVKDAKVNAKLNDIDNVKFICDNASNFAIKFADKSKKANLICVDPPRKGLDPKTIQAIIDISPEKIIYISCDPGTLARDLKILNDSNYKIRRAECVDMFPRTPHIENVTLLTK